MTPSFYPRFSRGQRLQHALLILSFGLLALTGLPQKWPAATLCSALIEGLGGIEAVRVVHRWAAVVLMATGLWHVLDVAYRVLVDRDRLSMLPVLADVTDFWKTLKYNFGRGGARPRMGRFTFEEKVEYWALLWGTVIMVVTGFVLWNPIATASVLPGQVIPAARVAHGGEALLAVLAVIVWHGYGVHLRHFNRSMFTGGMTEEEMRAEHPLELEEIERGPRPSPDPLVLRRRRALFLPVAAALTLALLAGLYLFVTFEQTAIETVPPPRKAAVSSASPQP